jgi:photosystem II stability/assembly factor-like uncharacterized protein
VTWNGSLFVAVGYDLSTGTVPKIMTSPDGNTWTARTPAPASAMALQAVGAASDGSLVAVGQEGSFNDPKISYSTNGTSWTAGTPDPASVPC